MKHFKKLRRTAVLGCVLLTLGSVGLARTRKGEKLSKLGAKALADKDYDKALDYFDQALATDPRDAAYVMQDNRIHAQAGQWHLELGRSLQSKQKLPEALAEFRKALLADPGSQIAMSEIQTTTQMIKDQEHTLPGTPVLTPAQRARQDMEKRINSLEGPPELRPINQTIRNLKMNNQPVRVLYESIGKLAGINVVFDPTGFESTPGKPFNVDLNNVTLHEALNYIALETHSFWKPISRNAIFVTQESDLKRTEYQDEVVKVFYLQNSSTQAEFTEIFNALRQSSKIQQGIAQVQSQNAIIVRGSPDAVALIEKMVHDLDKPKPEVLIDIVVMEVNKTKTRTLGASLLGQGGFSAPLTFAPRNPITIGNGTSSGGTNGGTGTPSSGTNTSNYFTVAGLGKLSTNDYATSLPSTVLEALLSDSSSRILQRPQLRCTDGGKANLTIGEKIPYVSGSLNSAVATPGSVPYATTQFQQVDVGVKIDLDPVHVNGPDDISMHIKVEISNENGQVSIGGIDEPIITQRLNEAVIRMRNGEVSLLGGLSDVEAADSNAGFPGLTNIPILGYLFGSKTTKRSDDEILIALIPHIVRAPDLSALGDGGVMAGTEHVVRVNRRPDGTLEPAADLPVNTVPQANTPQPVPQVPPAQTSPFTRGPVQVPPPTQTAPATPQNEPQPPAPETTQPQ